MSKVRDLTGQKFGMLSVVSRGENDKSGRATWNCVCECGNLTNVKSGNLTSGRTFSCGCIRITDISGKKFGRLTVICRAEDEKTSSGRNHITYICKCDCGNKITVKAESLRSGNTKSCGCLSKEITKSRMLKHGFANSQIYKIWRGMKQRCYYKNHKSFKDYGGRRITVCDEWKNDFQTFYDYVSQLPHFCEEGYSLDRINNNGNYEPANVRWATAKEQANNKRKRKKEKNLV